jgi:hypothetical protein
MKLRPRWGRPCRPGGGYKVPNTDSGNVPEFLNCMARWGTSRPVSKKNMQYADLTPERMVTQRVTKHPNSVLANALGRLHSIVLGKCCRRAWTIGNTSPPWNFSCRPGLYGNATISGTVRLKRRASPNGRPMPVQCSRLWPPPPSSLR